jgi:hypothetical protein
MYGSGALVDGTVFGDGQDEIHVQVLDVPLDGLLRVDAAVGDVVDLLDFHAVCLRWMAPGRDSAFHH